MAIEIFVVALILSCGGAHSELTCKDIEATSVHLRLRRYLFCQYDQTVRPTENDNNATTVVFQLMPERIEVDDEINIIDMHGTIYMKWTDPHLTWEPATYEGIKSMSIKSSEVWTPDITVHSATDIEPDSEMPQTECRVYSNGKVYCQPVGMYTARCIDDHTWWPFDIMNCTLEFGSWSHSSKDIEFRFKTDNPINWMLYQKDLEWEIVRAYATETVQFSKFPGEFNTKMLRYHILLKRNSSVHSIVHVVPPIVLMTMTLITLWLEPKSFERMIIANMNFISHLIYLQDIHWSIPSNGSNIPKLLSFYDASLILSTFSLILTTILRHVQDLRTKAPAWISLGTATILQSRLGKILLVTVLDQKASAVMEVGADDNAVLVSFNRNQSHWKYVSILISWLAFFNVLFAYVIILAMFIPTSTSGESYTLNS